MVAQFIKKYPVYFEEEEKVDEDLHELIINLMIKNPLQRLGSDGYEKEVLEHAYFAAE